MRKNDMAVFRDQGAGIEVNEFQPTSARPRDNPIPDVPRIGQASLCGAGNLKIGANLRAKN